MQIKSRTAAHKEDTSAHDAARYGQRLAEIAEHLATVPGEDAQKARGLLQEAADAAQQASNLMQHVAPAKLRLHLSLANQPDLLSETARFVLEQTPGDVPVTLHRGPSQQNLPFGVGLSVRLVSRLRAILGDDSVWTETRA